MREPEVVARVEVSPKEFSIIIRKAEFREDGKVDRKYGLSKRGDWIEVPELTKYPDECYLPISVYGGESFKQFLESIKEGHNEG